MGITDKVSGKVKQAAGHIADRKAQEVADLERETS